LQTDEEREHFIEQFWLRRDPTPGTLANEFKEEHYRRIAYTNEHYTPSSGLPGWKTDRGRVYITYGPPDEIEDHSRPNDSSVPYQQWRYRLIEGVGQNVIVEFVDPQRTNEFRMTTDPSQNVMALYPAGPSTVFSSIGDHPKVTVTVGSDRSVMIEVSLDPGFKPFVVFGQIFEKNGRMVQRFQDSDLKESVYHKGTTLTPGDYWVYLGLRNLNSEGASAQVSFTVK